MINDDVRTGEIQCTAEVQLLDADETCRLLGGSRPLNKSTLYRGIKEGKYPQPIHLGPQTARWLKREIVASIEHLAAARGAAQTNPLCAKPAGHADSQESDKAWS